MYQWQYRFVQEPLIPYKFQISYTFIYQVINQIHAHKVIKNPTRKRHIPTQLTSMMNQIHWRCQWLKCSLNEIVLFRENETARHMEIGSSRSCLLRTGRILFIFLLFSTIADSVLRLPSFRSTTSIFLFFADRLDRSSNFRHRPSPFDPIHRDSFTLLLVTRQLRAPGAYPLFQNSNNRSLKVS